MKLSKIAAAAAAAVMAASMAGEFSVPVAAIEKSAWPTPISDVQGNKEVENFKKQKPKISEKNNEYDSWRYYS